MRALNGVIGALGVLSMAPLPGAVVTSSDKRARFTVLTECLVRMEQANEAGTFEDRATLAVIDRQHQAQFKSGEADGVLTISTGCVTISYKVGSADFTDDGALQAQSASGVAPQWSWSPSTDGLVAPDNLLGTIRSLDQIETVSLNCTENAGKMVHGESLHCVWAPFSRSGWHVIDDSNTTILDEADWVTNDTSSSKFDWYLFGHGHRYTTAVNDFNLISGRNPLLPKYSLGVMFSRWFDVSFGDARRLIEDGYSSRGIPIDVWITDMDWHRPYLAPPGQDWTGWTFDRNLYSPGPEDFFAYVSEKKLGFSLNIHDAEGVDSANLRYPAMAKANGIDPSTNATVPAQFDDQTYMESLEDIMLQPFQLAVGNRWAPWRDWQQGGHTDVSTRNLNPTIWLNHASCTNNYRRGQNWRAWTLARYGGYGNQRYPTGFSGDVVHSWASLQFQVYFSSTASSVSYQWSNDIVGQHGDSDANQELHTRWVQWGAYSALFRTHDAGGAVGQCADQGGCEVVELWDAKSRFFEANRAAVAARLALQPTWYTLNQQSTLTGVMPLRPMYMAYPEQEASYSQYVRNSQFMVGDNIVASPVTAQSSPDTLVANWSVWLPNETLWFDSVGGMVIDPMAEEAKTGLQRLRGAVQADGIANITAAYALHEIPVFFRGGSVVARIPYDHRDVVAVARRDYTHLIFDVYPGGASGSASVYEDDGESLDYGNGTSATTQANYSAEPAAGSMQNTMQNTTVKVRTTGSYPGLPAHRAYSVRLVMSYPPVSVKVDGADVPYSQFSCNADSASAYQLSTCWGYDGDSLTLTVTAANKATIDGANFEIVAPALAADPTKDPINGAGGTIQRAIFVKQKVLDPEIRPGDCKKFLYQVERLASAGDALSHFAQPGDAGSPEDFASTLAGIPSLLAESLAAVQDLPSHDINVTRQAHAEALLASVHGF